MKNLNNTADKTTNHPNKGGRPKKSIVRNQHLAVKCSMSERWVIEHNAKNAGLPISIFLRQLGLKLQIKAKPKTLPKEVLALTGTLNHAAANLNQIAKKRNGMDQLDLLERSALKYLSREIKSLTTTIKTYFYDR